MKTIVTNSIKEAAGFIKKGDIAAFPTETVYGLGAKAYDDNAVKKIYKAKGRPADNPLIVHVASKKDISVLASEIPETAKKIIKAFFPGPITVILKKNEIISDLVTAGLDTIAIRMPSSKIARAFIKECGVPIAAPSANISGSSSPTSFLHVLQDFKGKIPCVLIGPDSKHGLESTVIDCSVNIPVILRPGVISLEQLKKIDKRITYQSKSREAKSPGQKYRHYAPKGKLRITNYPPAERAGKLRIKKKRDNSAFIGINPSLGKSFVNKKICKDLNDYAKNLFAFFRECDAMGIKTIYAEKVPEKGIGLAIMNRLKKASA
jgi:L-threonylcarbamoyladenylate synthase